MAEELAPPVVAVVVASNPGPAFEECLESLSRQTYASLTVLVVDAACSDPLASRVAAVAPSFYLHRLGDDRGFGANANVVLHAVQGSAHFLFCHDDVVLEPDVVSRLVEEAFRSNAGIVSPKLVDYNEPDRILQLGLGVDRYGAPLRRVERLEFDQAQHDEAREVFAAPGACTLVRSDLFFAIGGFDEAISLFGEDVDLCWRARIAGARVVVAPNAIVRHLEAASSGQRVIKNARALQWRHELRAVLKNYGPLRRVSTGLLLVGLSIFEVLYFLALGERTRVRQVVDAWKWNLSSTSKLTEARRAVASTRRVPDREVVRLMTRRTFRLWRFVRQFVETRLMELAEPFATRGNGRLGVHRQRRSKGLVVAAAVAGLVILFGSRSLLFAHLPLIGSLLPIPSPEHLVSQYFSWTNDLGLQHRGPTTPALLVLGVLGFVLFSSMGLVLKLWIVIPIVAGAFGVARLLRPFGSPVARATGSIAYLFLPLCWNDIARGDLGALVAFGGVPFVLARLARASGTAPFSVTAPPPLSSRAGLREILGLGLLLSLLGAFVPLVVLLAPLVAIGLVLGGLLIGEHRGGLRCLLVALGGVVVAFVVLFPWSLTFVQPHTNLAVLTGGSGLAGTSPEIGMLLRMDLGPIGKGVLGWAFLASGLFVLAVGRDSRLSFGIRLFGVFFATAGTAWAASEGWLGTGGGALRVLISPLAAAVAGLVGLGVATLCSDLQRSRFGWRHLAAVCFGIVAVAGLLPVLGASLSGRWGLPGAGYDTVLSWLNTPTRASSAPSRVAWIGDPYDLPLLSWQHGPGIGVGVSSGLPDVTRLWPSANPGAGATIMADLSDAESGKTVRLGSLLAREKVDYLVVLSSEAPVLGASPPTPSSSLDLLLAGLGAQEDLHQLPNEGGALVFVNAATGVAPSPLGKGGSGSLLFGLGVGFQILVIIALGIYFLRRTTRRTRKNERHVAEQRTKESGEVAPEVLVVSARAGELR